MTGVQRPELDHGPTAPGWAVQVAVAVTGVAVFLATTVGTGLPVGNLVAVSTIIVGVTAATMRRPGYLPLGVALVPAVIAMITLNPVGYTWRTPVLMLAVHAMVRLSWYAAQVTPTTRVELAVLRAGWPRFAVVNGIGQAVALFAGAVTALTEDASSSASSGTGWAGLMGAGALLVLALALRTGTRSWPSPRR